VTEDDLSSLPAPRRPFRRITLFVMAVTALFALLLSIGLGGELAYSLHRGAPRDLGDLSRTPPGELERNAWVRAEGSLDVDRGVRYARPLDRDRYRLAPIEGNPLVWVELRVPEEAEDGHFLPPASFVGRLIPAERGGLRYSALGEAAAEAGHPLPRGAWLLIDGESPAGTRWVLGLEALLLGFFVFNVTGIVRLLRPVRDV
jgi:hypothetical protein